MRLVELRCLLLFICILQKIVLLCGCSQKHTQSYQSLPFDSFPTSLNQYQENIQSAESSMREMQIQKVEQVQHYITIRVGTPGQKIRVVLDTGSSLLNIPFRNCTSCDYSVRRVSKYDPKSSTTFHDSNQNYTIEYMEIETRGYLMQDIVLFQDMQFQLMLMGIDKIIQKKESLNNSYSQHDGVLGLSKSFIPPTIFDIAYYNKSLTSNTLAFRLGLFNKPSYFYYNVSQNDFPEAFYVDSPDKLAWNIKVSKISYNQRYFAIESVIIDSGFTNTIGVPEMIYNHLMKDIFSKYCLMFSSQMGNIYCDCNVDNYPNITYSLQDGIEFVITPFMYLNLMNQKQNKCRLFIKKTESFQQQVFILGMNFMTHYTVIFNKQESKIGFVPHKYQLKYYFPSQVANVLHALLILLIFLGILMILMLQYDKRIDQSGIKIGSSTPTPEIGYKNYWIQKDEEQNKKND